MRVPEQLARSVLEAAIREERAAELLQCLFEGGSATVDRTTGKLMLATAAMLDELMKP